MEYLCKVCGGMLNAGMRQSEIILDGEEFAAHVDCADRWASDEITVYKITSPGNGSYYERYPENVLEMLKESDDDHEYIIKRTKMTRAKYETLEEFQGF